MAGHQGTTHVPLQSSDTALCLIPPRESWAAIDRLRFLYDKAHERWPPHVNLVYPFVEIEDLPKACELVTTRIQALGPRSHETSLDVRLDTPGVFSHRQHNTIYICDQDPKRIAAIDDLRRLIYDALGQSPGDYQPHMTVAQSQELERAPHKYLVEKARLLPPVEWTADQLYVLKRERISHNGDATSQMNVWGTIDLATGSITTSESPLKIPSTPSEQAISHHMPRTFSSAENRWILAQLAPSPQASDSLPESFTVASYNVLAEFDYPPSRARYPLLVRTLLHQSALADALVLQEVTDDFLAYLCKEDGIRTRYPFITHGPPDQDDLEPLPSHLNVVVLSKHHFSWHWLPFRSRHKGSVILQFTNIGKHEGGQFCPLTFATVHLTRGFTDGSVATKKLELQTILNHMRKQYPENPWALVGDFNITTSSYTIEAALKKKAITSHTADQLNSLDAMLLQAGLSDAWSTARVQYGDVIELHRDQTDVYNAFEGEQGATFDPLANQLAAETVGSGLNNRPQRYDRIMIKGQKAFSVTGFNLFGGKLKPSGEESDQSKMLTDGPQTWDSPYASDHWGIRCSLRIHSGEPDPLLETSTDTSYPVAPASFPDSLANTAQIKYCLAEHNMLPSEDEFSKRESALRLLKDVVMEESEGTPMRGKPTFVLVPVGSYGMGVWTPSSDIDCLCIGPVSSKTFFALATQRLRKAAPKGVKLLRRVNASSGVMLELEVLQVKMDLQYCASTFIAETWPYAMTLPPSDPVFSLSSQALAKLKPVRDMYYLRRTVPDHAAFRTAYLLVKCWAKQWGIYSARFGYLGGIHISILLARIHKLLSRDGNHGSVPMILATFFHHYANFNWKSDIAFDPFFHKRLRYVRTFREPMAILGFFGPHLNTAHAASSHSVRTISDEFKRASTILSQPEMTWPQFLKENDGAGSFLGAYKTYVKIDAQFWGVSLAKGSTFVSWLESRCVLLLVDLHRRLPDIHARIWPARFVQQDASETDSDYQGFYLIGLDRVDEHDGRAMTKDDVKITMGSLQTILQKFETQIRGDEKYFDANSCWMSASLVKQSEVGSFSPDSRDWGEYTVGDDDSEEEEEEEELPLSDEDYDGEAKTSTSKTKKGKKDAFDLPRRPAYSGKFRSSADVINRLRWDATFDSSDYIVGYEDRFLGTKERPLDQWKAEQTDEEFIPQHRILFFKRRTDGFIVWDRRERRDEIFGSGVSSSGAAKTGRELASDIA